MPDYFGAATDCERDMECPLDHYQKLGYILHEAMLDVPARL
jgi:hypothetical protein